MQFTRPRGTRDFLPEEMARRRYAEKVMRETFESYGYREVQTPVFESLELITAKSGEDIVKHLYDFKDKSQRSLALRPELTLPVMRLYISELQFKPKPVKLYYFGNCFRYEEPQAGRYREFWQAGVELIGTSYPEAEAEVIALAVEVLKKLGLKDFELHIGNIGILRKILRESGAAEKEQGKILHLIDKGERGELENFLNKLKISEENKQVLLKILNLAGDKKEVISRAGGLLKGRPALLKELEKLEATLRFLDLKYSLNLGIARGLDYYSGMVFEIYANKLGAQKQICGGGTYSLGSVLGGEETATCGFAFGFDRVMLALEAEKVDFNLGNKTQILVVPVSEGLLDEAIKISSIIRKSFSCEVDLMRRKLSKALAYANSEGIPFVVILGDEELAKDSVTLRNMKTGEQKEIKLNELEKIGEKI
ncbi:MAG: histidine--tRNA ligase [Candidatus Hydrothermarchaeota archaeon]|nr:histidine--tRNA ligase [Candidatus Hydrothermarchaeota archaeon]